MVVTLAGYFGGIEFDSGKIMKLCPTADDMWLKIVGAQKRIPAVKVSTNSKEWFTIRNSQRQCLMSVNTAGRMRNDEALQNLMGVLSRYQRRVLGGDINRAERTKG